MTRLPDLGAMPPIAGIDRWLNADSPLTKKDFLGHVTLLEFMTFSCVNCIRTFPTLARWHKTYAKQGLAIVGIHTPEFAFEHDARAVEDALTRYRLAFPIALDNDYVTWRNFQNRYWPATYLFDEGGRLRYTHIGEGAYKTTETAIRSLLKEAGASFERGRLAKNETPSDKHGKEVYFGHARPGNFSSPEKMRRGETQTYSVPESLEAEAPALHGRWQIEGERAVVKGAGAGVVVAVDANEVRAVIAPPEGSPATCRVRLNGKPPGKRLRGEDLIEKDGETYLVIDRPRSFQLLSGKHIHGSVEMTCLNQDTSFYNITF